MTTIRVTPLKRRKPLRQISSKRSKELVIYYKLRREWMENVPLCEVCGGQATDIHHKCGRGTYLNATQTWMSVCRECHIWIHNNPSESRNKGYICDRKSKN